jgi:hypothetical protein
MTKDNVKFIRDLMTFSKHGALTQAFIVEAIMRYAEQVSKAPADESDTALISGRAWKGVAEDIYKQMTERYG